MGKIKKIPHSSISDGNANYTKWPGFYKIQTPGFRDYNALQQRNYSFHPDMKSRCTCY